MYFQSTINKRVDIEGIGIHTGETVNVTLIPAPVDTGIVFKPACGAKGEGIQAHIRNLLFTTNAVTVDGTVLRFKP